MAGQKVQIFALQDHVFQQSRKAACNRGMQYDDGIAVVLFLIPYSSISLYSHRIKDSRQARQQQQNSTSPHLRDKEKSHH
jgi:hypothetical protein